MNLRVIGSQVLALTLLAVASTAHGAAAEPADSALARTTPAVTSVSYLAGGSVYVAAGSTDGVRAGDTLRVYHGGRLIALLAASYVSTRRASCDTLWTAGPLQVGDEVRFRAAAASEAAAPEHGAASTPTWPDSAAASGTPAPARPAESAADRGRRRGRIGARWLSQSTSDGSRYRQPALDLRFDDFNRAGNHVDASFDMRTRRTTRNFSGGDPHTDQSARVFRASLTVRSIDSNRRFTLGRQGSPTLASINLFDGALAETGNGRRTFGLFSGTQPDPDQYRWSTDILQSGAYVEWHQPAFAVRRWSVALGGVTSQQGGHPNRDFGFAQGHWFTRGTSLMLAQELDVNRGWKRRLGEPLLSATSTFGSLRVAANRWLAFQAGYDKRRNVRLYRDRLTPETEFDDAYREGGWLGSDVEALGHMRFSGEARASTGGDRSHTLSGSAEAFRFAPLHVTARARATRYWGPGVRTQITSAALAADPGALSHVEASGGVRRTRNDTTGIDDLEHWQGVDLDLTLGRRWYVNADFERDFGGSVGDTHQAQVGLNWRF